MPHHTLLLRRLLWLDALLGLGHGLAGVFLHALVVTWLGFPVVLVTTIVLGNLVYGTTAFSLARLEPLFLSGVAVLVYANWFWAALSLGMLVLHVAEATLLGQIFLVLQVPVVGGLAYAEGRLLKAVRAGQ